MKPLFGKSKLIIKNHKTITLCFLTTSEPAVRIGLTRVWSFYFVLIKSFPSLYRKETYTNGIINLFLAMILIVYLGFNTREGKYINICLNILNSCVIITWILCGLVLYITVCVLSYSRSPASEMFSQSLGRETRNGSTQVHTPTNPLTLPLRCLLC